jgi:hypothetical protein
VSDQAFWPLLSPADRRDEPLPREWIKVHAASDSPYSELLANACGEETVELSRWVKVCPGPCEDPNVARLASLTGHAYLIERNGQWLVWAIE